MGGSTLGNLAARRAALQANRKRLTGGADRGAPQAPTRAQPQPPPLSPQQPQTAPTDGQPAGGQPADGEIPTDEQALEQVGEFLQTTGAQAQNRNVTPRRTVEGVNARPGAEGPLIGERIKQLGVANRPPETQFFRIAGREPSPRELALFNSRLMLERQLKRPPTVNEMRTFIARGSAIAPLFSPAVERSGAGVAGPPPGG